MATGKDKIKVLFLCTGNSCRSQMAQGWARHLKGDVIESYSAGVNPIGVSRLAIEVMAEAGVDISEHRSRHLNEFSDVDFDYVVTLCDRAARNCPVFNGQAKAVHRSFEDPYFASGSDEEIMAVFRQVREDIKTFIETMPESLEKRP